MYGRVLDLKMNNLMVQEVQDNVKSSITYNLHRLSKKPLTTCTTNILTHKTFKIIIKKEVKS